jgi:3-hydroxyisobutyrate dehydrogenase-like beta-hydroxyacid dehydrogenase
MAEPFPGPVGFLHPGAMGAELAAACAGERRWVSSGRSPETTHRANAAGLLPYDSLEELAASASIIISVCPPDAAEEVASDVADTDFAGIYVDANAIAPATARRIGERFEHFVDGGIIGPPPTASGTTRLYLSGPKASTVASLWNDSRLEVRLVEGGAGAASAVKVCFAAWTKGSAALLLAIRALAQGEGVTDAIVAEWKTSMPDLLARAEHTAKAVSPKAWRFAGEMEQIAAAFAANDLPSGFHVAAAELYETLGEFKDRSPGPSLEEVLNVLGDGKNKVEP